MGDKYYSKIPARFCVKTDSPEEFLKLLRKIFPYYAEEPLCYKKYNDESYVFEDIEIPRTYDEYDEDIPSAEIHRYPDGYYDWDDADEWFCESYEEFYHQFVKEAKKLSEGAFDSDNIKLVADESLRGEIMNSHYDTVKEFRMKNKDMFVPHYDAVITVYEHTVPRIKTSYGDNPEDHGVRFSYWEKLESDARLSQLKDIDITVKKAGSKGTRHEIVYEALKILFAEDKDIFDKVIRKAKRYCSPVNTQSISELEDAIKSGKEYPPETNWTVAPPEEELEKQ